MNITNTMCRLSELSQWEIDRLRDAMPKTHYFTRRKSCSKLGFTWQSKAGFWNGDDYTKIVTYTEMMQLLGKTMEFTKSDLKTGMFVKYRNRDIRLVLGDMITGDNWSELETYDINLSCKPNKARDIMSVYTANENTSLQLYLKGQCLKLIWERTEQTPAQKEMEDVLAQISKLQEQAKVLQSKL
jgi:hypothetical protein